MRLAVRCAEKHTCRLAELAARLPARSHWLIRRHPPHPPARNPQLLRDHKGLVGKEKIRGVYDGTIWDTVAKEVEERKNRGSSYKQD